MTTCTVTAARGNGEVWLFQRQEIPAVLSFGANLGDAYEVMSKLVADAAGMNEGTVEIDLVIDEA